MSRREQIILLLTAIVVGAFVGDRWLVTPLMERRQALEAREAELAQELAAAGRLMKEKRDVADLWRQLSSRIVEDGSQAEIDLLNITRNAARDAGLTLASMQPDRPASKQELRPVLLATAATGDMNAVAHFLFALEQSPSPLRVERMRIAAYNGPEQLTLDLRLSTLYRAQAEVEGFDRRTP